MKRISRLTVNFVRFVAINVLQSLYADVGGFPNHHVESYVSIFNLQQALIMNITSPPTISLQEFEQNFNQERKESLNKFKNLYSCPGRVMMYELSSLVYSLFLLFSYWGKDTEIRSQASIWTKA